MSGMLVRKSSSVLVRPPSPPTATTATAGGDAIELSACDKVFVGIPNTALLVFREPIHGPAESIKRALTHALVHYRPLAGRLLRRADADADDDAGSAEEADDYYIACTGEGVSFVAATTASSIDDVRFFNRSIATSDSSSTPLFLDDLAVYYPTADGDRPLVLLQVTEFSCGGFVLGVTWNHAAADGAGMGQFINAVANLAIGLPSPSVLPVTRQSAVVVFPTPSPSLLDIDQHFRSFDPPPDMAFLDIVVPSSTIGRVRRRSAGQGRTATMFEAVTAVLWQCRTRAVMSVKPEPGAPTVLCFSADLRRHAGPKLDGYYGNFVTLQRAVSTSGEVAGGDIVEVVKMIQHAKDRIRTQFFYLYVGLPGLSDGLYSFTICVAKFTSASWTLCNFSLLWKRKWAGPSSCSPHLHSHVSSPCASVPQPQPKLTHPTDPTKHCSCTSQETDPWSPHGRPQPWLSYKPDLFFPAAAWLSPSKAVP
uniref:Uncharacterized protein n=1 Tax=Avena sativa TaxID=4498 RepID=A0ACD5YP77_AVESA